MAQILRQSTQVIVVIGPFVDVTDGFTPETGVTLSGADEAELLKGNTTTTTDISGATWAAITGCDGWYGLTLTTSLTDTVGALTVMVNDDSVCLPVFARFQVIEEAAYDAMYASSADPKADVNVASIDAGAITATAIATDAIDADALAADALAEIKTQITNALNVDTYAEIGQETPAATQTIRKMLGFLYKSWRNRATQTSSQYSLYADDATTIDQKATVSDNGTTFDKGEVATGP